MAVLSLKAPKKGVDNYFIAGDWHSHHCHEESVSILFQIAEQFKKSSRKLIINGDFIDAEFLMERKKEFKEWIKRGDGIEEYFLPKSEEELSWANDMLDQIGRIFPETIYIEGNHDWRYRWFMKNKSPHAYRPNFDLSKQLSLKKRGIKLVQYNDWLDIGRLSVTHGMFHGSSCTKRHYEASGGRSVVFSHVHKFECRPFMSRGETRQSWSLPAMCHLNPEYLKNTETSWSNGFGIIGMKPNGNFNLDIKQVWDNEVVHNGKIIRG